MNKSKMIRIDAFFNIFPPSNRIVVYLREFCEVKTSGKTLMEFSLKLETKVRLRQNLYSSHEG